MSSGKICRQQIACAERRFATATGQIARHCGSKRTFALLIK